MDDSKQWLNAFLKLSIFNVNSKINPTKFKQNHLIWMQMLGRFLSRLLAPHSLDYYLSLAALSLSLSSLRPAPRSFSRFVACFLFLPSSILLSLLPSSTQYKEAHQCALNILGLVAIKEKALEIAKRSIFYSISS